MNGLFPIIRRVRRPLIQENAEILNAEMLKPEPVVAGAIAEILKAETLKS